MVTKTKTKVKKKRHPRLVMNSLGEVIRCVDGNCLHDKILLSSVSTTELEQRLGRKPERTDFDAEFDRQAKSELNPAEYDFIKHGWELMGALTDGRFRVWGEMTPTRVRLGLVTEFCAFVDQLDLWGDVRALAKRLKAKIWTMRTEPHMDQRWDESLPGHEYNLGPDDTDEARLARVIRGPDDGRMERQIELSWDVTKKTLAEATALRDHLMVETQSLWDRAGVSVG